MKLISTLSLELEITGVFYNKDFILIVVESNLPIRHESDETKNLTEFLIKTNEVYLSDNIADYEELVYFDKKYMDFYEYPLLEILYQKYEKFIEALIPYIRDYALEHNLKFKDYQSTTELLTQIRERKSKQEQSNEKSKLFKFLNSGPKWLLSSNDKR